MTEEIKEILDLLKYCVEKNEYLEVANMKEWKPLLNYITNLQKENEDLRESNNNWQRKLSNYKSRNKKAVEYIKNKTKEINFDNDKLIDILNILEGGDE